MLNGLPEKELVYTPVQLANGSARLVELSSRYCCRAVPLVPVMVRLVPRMEMPVMTGGGTMALTTSMLAQIPHCLLAAHAGTIMGVETNSMQFCPEASGPEAQVHPGLYARRGGCLDLSSVRGPGFGYRLDEIRRQLPEPVARFG